MITEFKIFEEESLYNQMISKLKVGDYVIGQNLPRRPILKEFLENNVGQLYYIESFDKIKFYQVEYNYVPEELKKYFKIYNNIFFSYTFTWGEFWPATPEQIAQQKIKDDANKYNL